MSITTERRCGSKASTEAQVRPRPVFVTTHWSTVVTAGEENSMPARAALERLCRAYWYPLYAYVRRSGYSLEDAQDLTQAFFAQLLARNWIAHADPQKGRFRSFLLMVMKRFLAREWNKARADKRGGQVAFVPLPIDTAETRYTRYSREPSDNRTPGQVFEKEWALALLQTVLNRLRQDYAQEGKSSLFEKIEASLVGSRETQPYAELAGQLGMTEGAVKVAVHRLRARYRKYLEAEIANTVACPDEIDEELRHLIHVLARG